MREDSTRDRSRNVRRGASKTTLAFRAVVVLALIALGLGVVQYRADLARQRLALDGLKKELAAVSAGEKPAEQPNSASKGEVEVLQATLESLRSELALVRQECSEERDRIRREAGANRSLLARELAELKLQVAKQTAAPGNADPVEVIPPPVDEEPEDTDPEPPVSVLSGNGEAGTEEPPGSGESGGSGGEEAGTEEPAGPDYQTYKVRRGDTISGIAKRYRVEMADLLALNGISDPRLIQIGQELKIPE